MEMPSQEKIPVGNFRSSGTRDDDPAAEAVTTHGQHKAEAQAAFVFQSSQIPLGGLGKVINSFKLQLFKLQQGFSTVVLLTF